MKRATLCITVAVLSCGTVYCDPLSVVFVSGSFLYESDEVLSEYKSWLEENYSADVTLVSAVDWDDLPGLEALDTCDVALFYTRRLRIDGEQLQRIRDYVGAGRPVVAVRTASHGFENWPEFDAEVLGGNYHRHFPEGPVTHVTPVASHPVLEGVDRFSTLETLYRNPGIAVDCVPLMQGRLEPQSDAALGPEDTWTQPVAWVRDRDPGRVFYTSFGGADDFAQDSFKRLIANALYWAASLDAPEPSSAGAGAGTSSSESK